jgi:3D (Asp-Asp-Asp) domain-containing protein
MTETNIETVVETTSETSMENTEAETYLGYFRITGYVATGCKTASGTWPEAGRTIAMNATQRKNLGISFGDKIRIEGLGEYIVEDSGCKSGVIDVFCNSVSACYALTSHADVYLIKQ